MTSLFVLYVLQALFQDRGFTDPAQWEDALQEQIEVQFVMLDILALDRNGEPVTDLKSDDFEITDARKKVKQTFFETYDLRTEIEVEALETVDGGTAAPPGGRRGVQQIVVALDMQDLKPNQAHLVLDQLEEFIDGLDYQFTYKIFVYSLEYGRVTKGFTSDRRLVKEAVQGLRDQHFKTINPGPGGPRTLLEAVDDTPRRGFGPSTRASLGTSSPGLADLEKAARDCQNLLGSSSGAASRCQNEVLQEFLAAHTMRARRLVFELYDLTERFSEGDHPKNLVLLSPGFALNTLNSAFQVVRAVQNPGSDNGQMSPGFFSDDSVEKYYQSLLHRCMARRISYHVLDIYNGRDEFARQGNPAFSGGGGGITTAYRNYNNEMTQGLRDLARDTGGSFTQSFRFAKPLEKIITSTAFYYQLGYTAPTGKQGKWRPIKVKCKRKGVTLQYRRGYYGR